MSNETSGSSMGTADAGTPTMAPSSATGGMVPASTPSVAPVDSSTTNTRSQTDAVANPPASSVTQTGTATPSKEGEQPANPWESDENTYKKRFNDVLPHAQKTYQEKQALEQKYQQLESQYRKVQEAEQARAKQLALKDWNPRSPNYETTKSSYDRVSNFIKAKSSIPQEQQTDGVLKSLADSFGVTQDSVKLYHQIEADRSSTQEKMLSDPEAFLDSFLEQRLNAKFQQFEQFNNARTSAQQFLTDPKIQPLIQKYAVDMDRMMNPSVPGRDKALLVAQLMAENEAMKAKLGVEATHTAQAEAQQSLRQGSPSHGRRVSASQQESISDPVKHFTDKGLKGTALAMALARHNNQQR